jgi:hypothetical protein
MLWPMAMAVGAYLSGDQLSLRLVEIPTQRDQTEQEFSLEYVHQESVPELTEEPENVPEPVGDRVGVRIALTKRSPGLTVQQFRALGVARFYTIMDSTDAVIGEDQNPSYNGDRLKRFGQKIAGQLMHIKNAHPDQDLVVMAAMPKTVAMAAGWQLMQYNCRFYRGTYLMHWDQGSESLIPMRVRAAQPKTGICSPAHAVSSER